MKKMSSSEVKNQLGALLATLEEPVCIERHGKPVAYLFSAADRPLSEQAVERRIARLAQAGVEKDRLARHQQIAVELLVSPRKTAQVRIRAAQAEVDRWQRDGMCSRDYIRRWRKLLALPVAELAQAMSSDLEGWGIALRQNSPWRT
jgi:prevent-host-death family protein